MAQRATKSTKSNTPEPRLSNFEFLSKQEAIDLLDQQTRKYLGLSGEEFKRQYHDGTIADPERPAVKRLSFLLGLAEE